MSAEIVQFIGKPKTEGRGLTLLQRKALRFVSNYIASNGEWPTPDHIRTELGIMSRGGLVRTLEPLFERGLLQRPEVQ